MMKLVTKFFLALALAFSLASCGGGGIFSTLQMDSEEAVQAALDIVIKNVDTEKWKIIDLSWSEEETLENEIFFSSVTMIDNSNAVYQQSYFLKGSNKGGASDLRLSSLHSREAVFDNITGIDPKKFDAATIIDQINTAKTMIPEGYEFRSVARYEIKEDIPHKSEFLNKNFVQGRQKASFSLCIIEKGKETVTNAGKTSIIYYDVSFNVLEDGSVEMDE